MLSMKTLRVAIVTMGSALLLGPGLAAAIDLDQPVSMTNAPQTFALESLGAATATVTNMAGQTTHYLLTNDGAFTLDVTSKVEIAANSYLRLELGGGMAFGTDSFPEPGGWTEVLSIAPGDSVAVYRNGSTISNDPGTISFNAANQLAVPAAAGAYTASITVHENQNDALAGVGATSTDYVGGMATVIVVSSGLDAKITAGNAFTAAVDTGFLWFIDPVKLEARNPKPYRAHGMLGQFQAVANPMGILAAIDGQQAEDADIIAAGPMAVSVTIEGDLTIGAFDVVGQMEDDIDTADVDESEMLMACPAPSATPIEDPEDYAMGNLVNPDDAEDDVTTIGVASGAAGMYGLCVNVDVAGAETNDTPVPAGTYEATVRVTGPGDDAEPTVAASGTIGTIVRDGASVEISYLTTSEKHNQRLIITNRGPRPIAITDAVFQSEGGTEVELSALAQAAAGTPAAMIQPGETAVHSVSQMLSITGDSRRTAATLSFNANPGNVSVATTQVNLSDSSTDTVMWVVK